MADFKVTLTVEVDEDVVDDPNTSLVTNKIQQALVLSLPHGWNFFDLEVER